MRTIHRQVSSTTIDEFTFDTADDAPSHVVSHFSDWLVSYVANGAAIKDGHTLEFGFALLLCRVQSRMLTLLAPDFRTMPIAWITDLTAVFRVVSSHKYTPETFGFTPDIPTLGNTAIVGERFNELPFFANRLPPAESNPNDSGWFIGSQADDVDNNDPNTLRLMSLYEVALAVPRVLMFLSMPVGCQVSFTGGVPVILKDYEEIEIPKDSYLDRLWNS